MPVLLMVHKPLKKSMSVHEYECGTRNYNIKSFCDRKWMACIEACSII